MNEEIKCLICDFVSLLIVTLGWSIGGSALSYPESGMIQSLVSLHILLSMKLRICKSPIRYFVGLNEYGRRFRGSLWTVSRLPNLTVYKGLAQVMSLADREYRDDTGSAGETNRMRVQKWKKFSNLHMKRTTRALERAI